MYGLCIAFGEFANGGDAGLVSPTRRRDRPVSLTRLDIHVCLEGARKMWCGFSPACSSESALLTGGVPRYRTKAALAAPRRSRRGLPPPTVAILSFAVDSYLGFVSSARFGRSISVLASRETARTARGLDRHSPATSLQPLWQKTNENTKSLSSNRHRHVAAAGERTQHRRVERRFSPKDRALTADFGEGRDRCAGCELCLSNAGACVSPPCKQEKEDSRTTRV